MDVPLAFDRYRTDARHNPKSFDHIDRLGKRSLPSARVRS